MDDNKLQALRTYKLVKGPAKERPAQHVPGQGFSAESEKFFADLAVRKREEIDSQIAQDNSYKADHELDDLTRELRSEFARLNKILELREIAKQRSTKLSRRAAKAALKEAKKAGKKPKPVNTPRRTKPSPQVLIPASKWIKKICWRCNARFSIHVDWERPPSLCPACTKDINETYLPTAPERSTPVGWVHIVSGGAPGLGKRR